MHRHPISATWGRSDLASSDMTSMETSQRVFVARNDPRRLTPSVGIYSHTRDRWGISYAQPMVLNDRQAGAAIEGVVRDERYETAQLAVDTHGYTDVAMALARGVGLDLCPRLKELNDRHLFLPRGSDIPENLKAICHATLDPAKASRHWDAMVHLFASVHSGHSSAITVLARYGSAARGDPLYEAMVQVGKLLRTVFLCDYFVNEAFRRELLRVLNRGEAVNALKRAIYVGRVASYQAKQHEEMQARRRRAEPVGEPGDGLEHDEDAVGARPLERPTFHRGAAGADRTHRPDTHRGHQLAGRVHLPDRAIPGPATTVTSGSKITRLWRLNDPSERRKRHFCSDQNSHCIHQVIDLSDIFAHVFKYNVPALLARKSTVPLQLRHPKVNCSGNRWRLKLPCS
jgi:TnpA family transposase